VSAVTEVVRPSPESSRVPASRPSVVKVIAPLALVLAICALTGAAAGHAMLQRTEPRVESRLKRSPDEVKLYFTEPLERAYSSVRVVNDRGHQVDRGDSRVDRSNPALLRVTLPTLPRGTYRVRWRVLSIDADVTEGGFTFWVE
jgi:methionine-rich copper-binding protein CopC